MVNYVLCELMSNDFTVLFWQQIIFSILTLEISIKIYLKHIKISSGTNFSSILYSPLKRFIAEVPALKETKQLKKKENEK